MSGTTTTPYCPRCGDSAHHGSCAPLPVYYLPDVSEPVMGPTYAELQARLWASARANAGLIAALEEIRRALESGQVHRIARIVHDALRGGGAG